MTDRDALLAAVCAAPADDLPRLAFADWCDDHGDPDRAEFIRVQCLIAAQERRAEPREGAVQLRHQELLPRVAGWLDEDLPDLPGVRWLRYLRRGFAEMATVEADAALLLPGGSVFDYAPVQHLVVSRFQGQPGFADIPGLAGLRSLELIVADPLPGMVDELLRWTRFRPDLLLTVDGERHAFAGRTAEVNQQFGGVLRRKLSEPPPPSPPPPARRPRRRRG